MEIRTKLKPGQKGTRKLLALYGAKLVCVRYCYDQAQQKRYTTVELIVDEAPWQPTVKALPAPTLVQVKIAYGEAALARQVRAAGGQWNRAQQVWELPAEKVAKLRLEARIVPSKPPIAAKDARKTPVNVSISRNQKASTNRS